MTFVCDAMLGKLARYFRIFGLDAVYAKTRDEFEYYMVPEENAGPYLFTRRLHVRYGSRTVIIQSDKPKDQLREVWHIVGSYVDLGNVMTRCIGCNVPLVDVPRVDIEPHVPEYVFHKYKDFRQCPACGKIYWQGTHALHMSRFIEEVSPGRSTK